MSNWVRSFPRGVPLLCFNIVIMYMGFYALIPFLSQHLKHDLLWSTAMAGALLAVRQFSQQGITLFTGMLADRLGYKLMLISGVFIRGLGFALFGVCTTPFGFFSAAIVAALGGAIFEPTQAAALTALTPEAERGRMYAVKKMCCNIGIALSALCSVIIMHFDFQALSLYCGGVYFVAGILCLIRLPKITVQIAPVPFGDMIRIVLRDRYFLLFTLINAGYYFMYMQVYLTIPMRAVALTNQVEAVFYVNLLLALVIILGQYPVNRFLTRYSLSTSIILGLLSMACGLVVLGTTEHLTVFAIGFVLFALGMMIVEPTSMEMTAKLAKPEVTASYFGFALLALALGGGIGQGVGGYLLDTGTKIGFPSLVWWVASFVGVLAMLGMAALEKTKNRGIAAETLTSQSS
ncbi:MAG: MFS transporter [Tumebacillaceae bacterium]